MGMALFNLSISSNKQQSKQAITFTIILAIKTVQDAYKTNDYLFILFRIYFKNQGFILLLMIMFVHSCTILQFRKMTYQKNLNLKKIHDLIELIASKIGMQNLALSMMAVSNILWPLSFLFVSQHNFSPYLTIMARGTAVCVSHILICMFLGIDLHVKSAADMKNILLRNTLIGFHQLVYAAMHFVLSFPLVNSIIITGPLFVFVIDYYLNGVTINQTQIIGIIVSFAGILVSINGELLMTLIEPSFTVTSTFANYHVTDIQTKIIYSLLAVLTNVVWAYGIVIQKKVKHLPGITTSFYLGVWFILTSGVSSNVGIVQPVTLPEFMAACFFSGLVIAFCQLLYISSLNLTKNSGKLTILNLLFVVTGYAISFFKFKQNINLICLGGLALMGFGLYRTVFFGNK